MRQLLKPRPALAAALVGVFLAGMFAGEALAGAYYVDFDGGSDGADGRSPRAAFRHCPGDPDAAGAAASARLEPGDTVIFKGGVSYRGRLVVKWPGAKDRPIVYDGNTAGEFGKGRAVLDGGEPVAGWRRCVSAGECGGNPGYRDIYTAYIPGGAKDLSAFTAGLVQDGKLLYPAQYPNPSDPFYGDKLDMFLGLKSGMTGISITDTRLAEIGGPALVGGYACVYVAANDMAFARIASYDDAARRISFASRIPAPAGEYAVANSLSPKVFDRPGEYVFDETPDGQGRHRVFVRPWEGKDLARGGTVTWVARPLGVDMGQGNHHVTLRGFLIRNYQEAIRVAGADGVVIRDNEITAIRQTGFANAVNASRVNDLLFAGNYVHDLPKMRTIVSHTGERVVYEGNTVVRGGRSPLVFYNIRFGRIVGNRISDCRGMHSNGISIYVDCRDILVARNDVRDSNICMTLQNAERVTVYENLFASPDACIGLWGGTPHRDHRFINNLLFSSGQSVYVNTTDVSGCVFVNNILAGFNGYRLAADNTLSHNLYLKRRLRLGEGEFIVPDPALVFLGPGSGDFRPRPAGPAVDMGADVSPLLPRGDFPGFAWEEDFAGRARTFGPRTDMGPYEAAYPAGALARRPPIPTGSDALAPGGAPLKPVPGAEPVIIPAVKYSGEGGGKVDLMDPSTIGFVDFVTRWDAPGHWLEYTVDAASAGDAELRVRYTTAADAPRQITVNGQAVKGLESVLFKATGGWKNYRALTLPAAVPLRRGANTVRFTSLGGDGCNLNSVTVVEPGGRETTVYAGSFAGEGGGKVEVVPGPRHGLFYSWNDAGHWLEWTVENAKAGRYQLRLRYATLASAPRRLDVNGQAVKGLEEFQLDQTDGWRRCEEISLPAALVLKEGRNALRMTSLGGGGLNLDELRLVPVE